MIKRTLGKIAPLFSILILILTGAETAPAAQYRFWLHDKIRFPYTIYGSDTTGGSDCWGWRSPDGTQYAIMGVRDGIAIVSAQTMEVKAVVPGPQTPASYYWRDVETYQHYAYAVSELSGTNQGLTVIDLQYLPDSVHFVGSFPTNLSGNYTAHTIAIDTAKGFAYCERNGGLGQPIVILSLANPEVPAFVGSFGPTTGQSIHDMYARNDTVFVAEGWDASSQGSWSVWDCANKASPALITRVFFPGAGYVHSTWPTEDRNFLLTTEEIPAGKTMKLWDIADLGNIDMRGQYIGAAQIPHNVYPKGNLVFVSHYEAGVTVVDISNPDTLMEVARYDTYLASDNPQYRGCWSAFPYTSNGFVYASNLDGWLFVLRFGRRGDLNFDMTLTAADIVLALNCAFQGIGDCPLEIADGNCDGRLSGADIVLLVKAVFLEEPFPC